MMLRHKVCGVVLFIVSVFCLVIGTESASLAQGSNVATGSNALTQTRDEPDYDIQLDLVVASNGATEKSNLPQSLEGTIRQLRTSLPFAQYRLATTFLSRVTDGGSLDARGVGSFLIISSIGPNTPTFYDFAFFQIKRDKDTPTFIRIAKFRFNLRVPIVTGTTHNETGNASFPTINYETVGLTTEVSIRQSTPTLVGTFATGRSDELVLLILTVRPSAPK